MQDRWDEYYKKSIEFTRKSIATDDPIEKQIIEIEKEFYKEDFFRDEDYRSGISGFPKTYVHMDERADKLAQLYAIRDLQKQNK